MSKYKHGTCCGGDGCCDAVEEATLCVDELVHCWTSRGCGGMRENPGVWSRGGTTYAFHSRCVLCGMQREEVRYGSQRNPDQCDTVRYVDGKYPVDPTEARAEATAQRRNARRRALRRAAAG